MHNNNKLGYLAEPLVFYRSSEKSYTWKQPESFISDLDIMREEYIQLGINIRILDPLYITA